jgi:hypothetical protein
MPKIFISYSTHDQASAEQVCQLLEQRGITCWIAPRDITPGADYDEEILDAIEATEAAVLILSSNANESHFVKNEVNLAFSKGKRIYPFRIEEVTPGKSLAFYLASYQWTDGFGHGLEAGIGRLAAALQALLGKGGLPESYRQPDHPTASAQDLRSGEAWKVAAAAGPKKADTTEAKPFFLEIEDVFLIKGRGIAVTGQIKNGSCQVGQEVTILKDSVEVRTSTVVGIAMSRKQIQVAEIGDNVGLLLRGVAEGELERGMVVVGMS